MAKQPARPAARAALPAWLYRVRDLRGYMAPVGFVLMLVVLLVPLAPVLMDALIALNISLAVVILLTTIYMKRPLDFSVFPSLLLATTLFRLVLNIASTRLILTADASSPDEALSVAGEVINAFGQFVAGESLFVGVVLFLIIVIVQFVVITKGATRISEVAARFTLDAMPGKQMAIDADLNAGLIDEAEARRRREEIRSEADFFGAMDGASKFVRGDAIAGIIITCINVLGGFAVGVVERGWDAGRTADVFTRLTIGDGLTSQIPSFVIAIASALIVTRSTSKSDLGDELTGQVVSQPRGLIITACFLALLSFTPLPTTPLMLTALLLVGLSWAMRRAAKASATAEAEAPEQPAGEPPPVESLLKVDVLELEVGYSLVGLVDAKRGGDLLERISGVRRQLALELGLVMPPVRIRDNMQLAPGEYRLKIRGNTVGRGEIRPDKLMAMDSGLASGSLVGEQTTEPAFGLKAWWIDTAQRSRAEAMNYTVVDSVSVLTTHTGEVVRRHAQELLTREEVNNLIEGLKERAKRLVEEAIPSVVKVADLHKVLQNLLRERVPIRDLETIVETLADWMPKTRDLGVVTEYVRNALRRTISHIHSEPGADGVSRRLFCVTLDPQLEDVINSYIDRGQSGTTVAVPPRVLTAIVQRVLASASKLSDAGRQPVIIASPQVRGVFRQLMEPHLPGITVLGYNEVDAGVEVESLDLVTLPESTSSEPVAA